MVKIHIPSNRIYDFTIEGGTSLPSRPRMSGQEHGFAGGLVGGSTVANESLSKIYVAVDSDGVPLLTGGKQRTYQSSSPSGAAIKAFHSWWRTSNQGSLAKGNTFEDAQRNVSQKHLHTRLLVRIAPAGKSTVRNYVVNYEINANPNTLEREKLIVAKARAKLIGANDVRPSNVIDF